MRATDLERQCADLFGRQHAVTMGRGAWAIALILETLESRARRRIVALPSFLCHTPLAAVVRAGWTPLFCDVDPATGLVSDAEWAEAVRLGADALLFVHLFGNPADPGPTAALCRDRQVFFIEDACQAVGAQVGSRPCGSFGDVSVLSFGHTKTIDLGSGGLMATDDAGLAAAVREAASQHKYLALEQRLTLENEFHELFYQRKARLTGVDQGSPAEILSDLIDRCLPTLPAPWMTDASALSRQLDCLPELAARRRRKFALYSELLAQTRVVPVPMSSDAAPWRFCFRLPGIGRPRQEALSSRLRAKGLHVSTWYLPTHWMLPAPQSATGGLPGTLQLSSEIFQFWLDDHTDERQIHANVDALKEALTS